MIIEKFKGRDIIEYSIVNIHELEEGMRIDSEYYDPECIRNEALIKTHDYTSIEKLISNCEYGISIAMNMDNIGYKMLKMDDITGILADDSNCKYAEISEKTFQRYRLTKGDILFNRVNSEEFVGRTGIYLLDGEHTFASYLIRVRAKKDHANFYITIFLNSVYGKKSLRRLSRRAVNQANINAVELKSLDIPIPSDDFQKKIREMVNNSQDQIENARNTYRNAEEIFLDEIGLKNWKPTMKTIRISDKQIEVEENISIRNLSDVLNADRFDAEYWDPKYDEIEHLIDNYNNGYDYLPKLIHLSKDKIYNDADETYNYIELADINPNLGSVDQTQEITGANLPSRAKMMVNTDDILLSSVEGSVNKIALIDFNKENLVASTGFFVFRENKLNKETILVMLKALSEIYIKRQAQGTILTAIPSDSLWRIKLPNLEQKVQKIITKKIQESLKARRTSRKILKNAVRSVDIFIEKNEEESMKYLIF